MRFGRVERQDEQHGIVSPLDGLVEHERGIARHAVGNAVLGELERVCGEREPMVAMAQGFGVAFLRVAELQVQLLEAGLAGDAAFLQFLGLSVDLE